MARKNELQPQSCSTKLEKRRENAQTRAEDTEKIALYEEDLYDATEVKEETIQRFITYFKTIVSAVIHNPEQVIAGLDIIPRAEKQRLLRDFNDTAAAYPTHKTIQQLFREQAADTPGHIAAALGAPLVLMFGRSNPARIAPYKCRDCMVAVEPYDRELRHINSPDPKHSVKAITFDEVYQKACEQITG